MTQEEFNEQIKDKNILVDFYANWCGPCKMLAPHIREAEEDLKALGVTVLKVNVDDSDALSSDYKINFIPTVIFFVSGVSKAKFTGVKDKEGLIKFVKDNL